MPDQFLKIYVNRNLMGELSYVSLLFPFWGPILKQATPYQTATFEKYNFDKSYYRLVDDIKEADFVLVPHNYWYLKDKDPELLEKCIDEAHSHNKLLLIDALGDPYDNINVKNAYVMRTSQYRFKLKENEIMIPAYAEDLLETYLGGKLQVRKKEALPTVGFTGWAELPFADHIKLLIKELPLRFFALFSKRYNATKKGLFFRKRALNILKKSALIKTNFIIRKFFSGHAGTIQGDPRKIHQEFINNIISSDYILCVKGDGNYSIRFYETLSLGRIPLFVDTETVLPLEDVIDYKDFCVFVDYRDLSRIDKILEEFHKNLNDERFELMQKKARDAFENYLRIDKFTKYLIDRLSNIAENFYKHG